MMARAKAKTVTPSVIRSSKKELWAAMVAWQQECNELKAQIVNFREIVRLREEECVRALKRANAAEGKIHLIQTIFALDLD